MTYTVKVLINEKGEVVGVEPPTGKALTCKDILEYSDEGEKIKKKLKSKKKVDLELWELQGDADPCIVHGGRLWCW